MRISNYGMTLIMVSITVALGGVAISTSITPSTVFANHEFAANLTGQQEVPPVDTQAMGEAIFVPVLPANETMDFYVHTTDIQGATAGHIHQGVQGQNGEVIVPLFNFDTPQDMVSENGTITAEMFAGPMEGMTIADLLTAMKAGNTYVNIHTEKNPNGEIRGQLVDIP
ncbi:MAG: CHRD domain-containing protein [Candidatus Nitrosocosmicus sp.]|nr:CHRD domain-containing protein [Candidatus Nitrosocosmicus sp.]MDN5868675.1 CHRD domain-containing protein [Candidatus Nitrosocosmicus sp.]